MGIDFTPITPGACIHVAKNMRERDWREITAVLGSSDATDIGYAFARNHAHRGADGFVCKLNGESVAVMSATYETPRSVQVALYATDAFNRVAVAVTRRIKRQVMTGLVNMGITRAECRCWEGHDDARRWLAILGASEECLIPEYGANGETFVQMAWRPEDVYVRA